MYDSFKGRGGGGEITANFEKKLILFRYPSSLCVIQPYLRQRDPPNIQKAHSAFFFFVKTKNATPITFASKCYSQIILPHTLFNEL